MQSDTASFDVSSATPIPPVPAARTAAATKARITHGMYSKEVVIGNENPDEFEAFRRDYHDDWNPWGKTEQKLVDNLAAAQWKLDRLNAEESGMYEMFEAHEPPPPEATFSLRVGCMAVDSAMNQNPLAGARNHHARLSNVISKAIRNLMLLQKERPKEQRRGGRERFNANPQTVGPGGIAAPAPDTAPRASPSSSSPSAVRSMAWTKMTDRGPGALQPAHAGEPEAGRCHRSGPGDAP
jgi:hypothetical protein